MQIINDLFIELDTVSGEPSNPKRVINKKLLPLNTNMVVTEMGDDFTFVESDFGSFYVIGSYREVCELVLAAAEILESRDRYGDL